jgi:imidazole glycerol phosphate synthase subunit HisF
MTGCLALVTQVVHIPSIAAWGVADITDFVPRLLHRRAAVVAAASIYHFTNHTSLSVKSEIAEAGLPMRI